MVKRFGVFAHVFCLSLTLDPPSERLRARVQHRRRHQLRPAKGDTSPERRDKEVQAQAVRSLPSLFMPGLILPSTFLGAQAIDGQLSWTYFASAGEGIPPSSFAFKMLTFRVDDREARQSYNQFLGVLLKSVGEETPSDALHAVAYTVYHTLIGEAGDSQKRCDSLTYFWRCFDSLQVPFSLTTHCFLSLICSLLSFARLSLACFAFPSRVDF